MRTSGEAPGLCFHLHNLWVGQHQLSCLSMSGSCCLAAPRPDSEPDDPSVVPLNFLNVWAAGRRCFCRQKTIDCDAILRFDSDINQLGWVSVKKMTDIKP